MCDNWKKSFNETNMPCQEEMTESVGEFVVRGKVPPNTPSDSTIVYWAANPATYSTSYSGSCLPYPNPNTAFSNTPNKGATRVQSDGSFEFRVQYPNSFYSGLGTLYHPPKVYIKICNSSQDNKVQSIVLGEGTPFRLLTYPPPPSTAPRKNPMFYNGRDELPVRTQEQVLRASGYPKDNKTPTNFWGMAVPQ